MLLFRYFHINNKISNAKNTDHKILLFSIAQMNTSLNEYDKSTLITRKNMFVFSP